MKQATRIAWWDPRSPGGWLLGLLVNLALCSAAVYAADKSPPPAVNLPRKMTLQDGKLTAQIVATPLRYVMAEVSRLSGVQLLWLGEEGEEQVSVEFTALPLSEAVGRILSEKNFMLFYTSAGRGEKLAQIWICPQGTRREKLGRTPRVEEAAEGIAHLRSEALAANAPDSRIEAIETLSLEDDKEPVGEVLAQVLASDPALQVREAALAALDALALVPLDTISQTALNDTDPSLRVKAMGLLATHAVEDPRVKGILSYLARSDSDPEVREAASELEGME